MFQQYFEGGNHFIFRQERCAGHFLYEASEHFVVSVSSGQTFSLDTAIQRLPKVEETAVDSNVREDVSRGVPEGGLEVCHQGSGTELRLQDFQKRC